VKQRKRSYIKQTAWTTLFYARQTDTEGGEIRHGYIDQGSKTVEKNVEKKLTLLCLLWTRAAHICHAALYRAARPSLS